MGVNLRMRRFGRIRKYPHWYDPVFGASREWKSDYVASILYMFQDGGFNINLGTDEILSPLAEWGAEDCMDAPETFHMRESYVLKSQIHDHNTPTYMEALSWEHSYEYYKTIGYEIPSLMRRDTC